MTTGCLERRLLMKWRQSAEVRRFRGSPSHRLNGSLQEQFRFALLGQMVEGRRCHGSEVLYRNGDANE